MQAISVSMLCFLELGRAPDQVASMIRRELTR